MIDREELRKPHMCPVCGKFEFPRHGSCDICEECGWEDDIVQEEDPDFGGANPETLNGYRALHKAGKLGLTTKERIDWLKEHGFFKESK